MTEIDAEQLDRWYPPQQRRHLAARLVKRLGITGTRAEFFLRLWIYLLVKQQATRGSLSELVLPQGAVECTHREAAELFYCDRDSGSDRAAGMMLDKLAALGLIRKHFDGNTTNIEILPASEILDASESESEQVPLQIDTFDPRSDAIPVANLLAPNYNWMNRNKNAIPYRIAKILRAWAKQYDRGLRVLRRQDNLNPVGFYALYPVASVSEVLFFEAPSKGLHLSSVAEVDPFQMAVPGDEECLAVFVRSWFIDETYLDEYRVPFIQDLQQMLQQMQQDFPNLCDLHSLIIHPSYEALARSLGFQKTSADAQLPVYWVYQALDRFLAIDIRDALARLARG